MPLFRRPISKAAANYAKAKKANKSEYNVDGEGRALIDMEGWQGEDRASKRLDKLTKLRSKGPIGLIRKTLSPAAMKRLIKLRKYQANKAREEEQIRELESKGFVVKKPASAIVKRRLDGAHPLLKGISTGNKIEAVSLRGNHYYGEVVDAVGPFLFIREKGKKELSHLKLDRLKEVNSLSE